MAYNAAKKVKVINVITDSNIGGAGNMLLVFLQHYNRELFDMAVVVPENSLLKPRIGELGVKCIEAAHIAESSLNFKSIQAFKQIFKAEKPGIVHTHASMSARIAARMSGKCKIIHTRHSVFDVPNMKKRFPLKHISGFINNALSDTIIAVSPAAMLNLTEMGTDKSKIKVVYNGVNAVKRLEPSARNEALAKLNIPPGCFICGIAARLEYVKGHEYILQAAKLLQDASSGVYVLIAGTGSIESELKQEALKMGLKNCLFLGFVSDMQSFLNIIDVQLNASYGTEATSLSLLEGMSLGVPAIASDFGGNPFVIEHGANGLVVPKKDAKALFDAIMLIKSDKVKYAKMQESSIEIFNKKFTANVMSRAIEEIYKGICL